MLKFRSLGRLKFMIKVVLPLNLLTLNKMLALVLWMKHTKSNNI